MEILWEIFGKDLYCCPLDIVLFLEIYDLDSGEDHSHIHIHSLLSLILHRTDDRDPQQGSIPSHAINPFDLASFFFLLWKRREEYGKKMLIFG